MRSVCSTNSLVLVVLLFTALRPELYATAQSETKQRAGAAVTFPPKLPGGMPVATHKTEEFLKPPSTLRKGVAVAKAAPTVDFLYYPGQTYEGKPWSNWGDSLAVGGKYYASIGDHLAIGSKGNDTRGAGTGRVFEYNPVTKAFRQLVDIAELLDLPKGHYVPGKIHGRLDLGKDGWLYFSTHRGSTTVTSDVNHYQGDWILRCDPTSAKSEVVVRAPVSKHCLPASVLDPDRLIFYGGTAPGTDAPDTGVQFFAYDLRNKKLLYSGPEGPARYLIYARSSGRVYYVPGKEDMVGSLLRYDPDEGGAPVKLHASLGLRAATQETPQGLVYTVSGGGRSGEVNLYVFDTKSEKVEDLGPASVGSASYTTSIDADPTGRYLYYVPGAHGGSELDGSPIVQFDTKSRQKKVVAFLHPYFRDKYGATLVGTYSSAVDPEGDKIYVTWNVSRGGRAWDCCVLTVIHIPDSERPD